MANVVWTRIDDPVETVKILTQERTPNGKVTFEFLTPESAKGRKSMLTMNEFNVLYYNPFAEAQEEYPPRRPTSQDGAIARRKYALYLEQNWIDIEALIPVEEPCRHHVPCAGPCGRTLYQLPSRPSRDMLN